jgi:putative Holliday junction resolvase
MSRGPATIESRGKVLAAEEFARALPAGARLLGLDVGTKTVGLALSDVTRTIASGLTTLARGKFSADAQRLLELAQEHGVGGFVSDCPSASTARRDRAPRPRAPSRATSGGSRRCPSCSGTSG